MTGLPPKQRLHRIRVWARERRRLLFECTILRPQYHKVGCPIKSQQKEPLGKNRSPTVMFVCPVLLASFIARAEGNNSRKQGHHQKDCLLRPQSIQAFLDQKRASSA